jgi:hypothetical protein
LSTPNLHCDAGHKKISAEKWLTEFDSCETPVPSREGGAEAGTEKKQF